MEKNPQWYNPGVASESVAKNIVASKKYFLLIFV